MYQLLFFLNRKKVTLSSEHFPHHNLVSLYFPWRRNQPCDFCFGDYIEQIERTLLFGNLSAACSAQQLATKLL